MKKSSFWTFVFSLVPGAGQMYLGYLKRGVSVMLLFFGIIFLSSFWGLGAISFVLPVIWFFAFFDSFHIRDMTQEEKEEKPDRFFFDTHGGLDEDFASLIKKRHFMIGAGCILVGAYLIFNVAVEPFMDMIHAYVPWLYTVVRSVPSVFVAVLIIALGIYLVRGKNQRQQEDIKYLGDETNGGE
jgi:TM2 domain-containing membrane protein YozV